MDGVLHCSMLQCNTLLWTSPNDNAKDDDSERTGHVSGLAEIELLG